MINLLDLSIDEFKEELIAAGFKKYKATQILDWIYKKRVFSFEGMSNISKSDTEKLKKLFKIDLPVIIDTLKSRDGTKKYLLELADGNVVESVLMKYSYGYSICISCQAGCRMNCSFCASGKDGLERNLSPGEMTGQILAIAAQSECEITRVVVMGTGEAFDNYDNFIKFIEIANEPNGLDIGQRKITVSTCGIVPRIYDFADYGSQVNLAISLHDTDNESRSATMPVNKSYPIEELIRACRYYIKKTNRRLSFEYALIPGINDSIAKAGELAKLLKGMLCYVNIIPVNRIDGVTYKGDPRINASSFYDILEKHGIQVTVRRELGTDIRAACGQLRRSHADKV
ncbi:MAG: 23S rRNA (adenine(2503)-C(2))-methyltransferase RlmN [Clostridiales bacterium]|nr:23S rRNA (adenine(2503)-C(2))-methyltransferase RlmN [Clostridiales bacterium]